MKKERSFLKNISNFKDIRMTFPQARDLQASFKTRLLPAKKYIVAVSGGSDSMLVACLIYHFFCLQQWDLQNLILIHCHHKVRPESDQEARFVQKFFKGCKLIIAMRKQKLSRITEENLRKRRYQEFQRIAKKEKAAALILGHHLTDRIESTFLNMLRGAHLKGFIAMKEYDQHPLLSVSVYRPFIHLSKQHILDLCQSLGVPFVEDPTNADILTSRRNKFRNVVFPLLSELASKPETFLQSRDHVYAELEKLTEKKLYILTPITTCSLWKATSAFEIASTTHEWTNETTMQVLHALGIAKNLQSANVAELTKFFTTAEQGYKYFQGTYFFLAHGHKYAIQAPINFRAKAIEKSKQITTLGQVKRYNFTLPIVAKHHIGATLRFAKASDRYHGKTRNQYCITAKIPVFRRNFVPVLVKEGKIIHVFKDII